MDWTPGSSAILPITLQEYQTVEIPVQVSENLTKWEKDGRVRNVELNIRISGLEADLNEIRIKLNGDLIPDEILTLEDLTFRYLEDGKVVAPYGFVYKIRLSPD